MIIPARWRRPLTVAALWAGALLLVFDVSAALSIAKHPAVSNDFRLCYMAARLVLDRGWPSLYDFAAQRSEAAALGFFWQPFINPPPLAAWTLPFVTLPFSAGLVPWTVMLIVALASASLLVGTGSWLERMAQLALVGGLFPVAFGVMVGQPPALVGLALAGAWWLLRNRHPMAAGAVLGLVALKPQLGFLVPLALLVSGRVRPALVAIGVLAALALGSAALVGGGLGYYMSDLQAAASWEISRRYGVAGVFPAPAALLIELAAAVVGLAVARRLRVHLEAVFAAGIAASLLVTPHIGIQDLTVLAVAGLLVLRTHPPIWQVAVLLIGYPLAELALALPPILIVAWRMVWLGSLLLLRPDDLARSDDLHRAVGSRVGTTAPG